MLVKLPTKPEEELDIRKCDFGHSRRERPLFSRNFDSISGTRCYRSSEVMDNMLNTTKLDIWSAGVVCYEMLTRGDFPFSVREENALYQDFRSDNKESVDAPEELKDILHKLLERDPKKRLNARQALIMPIFRNQLSLILTQAS